MLDTFGDLYTPMMLTWGMATTLIMVIFTPLVFLASGYPGIKGILVYTAVPAKGLCSEY